MNVIEKFSCKDSTKNRYLALTRAILRKAADEWRWLEKASKISLHQESKRRIRWLNQSEADRLLRALPNYLAVMAQFSLLTGLRQSNILNLRWSQIDLERRVAWINPDESKSGRAIGIALNTTALALIQKQKGRHPEYSFTNSQRKHCFGISSKAWKKALRQSGICDFRWHGLHHSWASWLV